MSIDPIPASSMVGFSVVRRKEAAQNSRALISTEDSNVAIEDEFQLLQHFDHAVPMEKGEKVTIASHSSSKPSTRAFQGDFLFINHNAQSREALPHQREIFTHVQSKYQRWKKREGVRTLRESAKALTAGVATISRTDEADIRGGHGRRTSVRGCGPEPAQTSLIASDSLPRMMTSTPSQGYVPRLPTTLLQKGNSDPFDALPITVDAKANELFLFLRDSVHPALFNLEIERAPTSKNRLENWHRIAANLRERDHAYGWLAVSAAVMANVAPDPREFTRKALVYRTRGSVLLRQRMLHNSAGKGEKRSPRSVATVEAQKEQRTEADVAAVAATLATAELFGSNYDACAVHLAFVRRTLLHQYQTYGKEAAVGTAFPMRWLQEVIFLDNQRAAMTLSRPIFETDGWLGDIFQPLAMDLVSWVAKNFWPLARDLWTSTPVLFRAATGLDSSIDKGELRISMRETRIGLVCFEQLLASLMTEDSWATLTIRPLFNHNRLLSFYVDLNTEILELQRSLVPGLAIASSSEPATLPRLCSQAAATLTAIYWGRCAGQIEGSPIGSSKECLFRARPRILGRVAELRALFEAFRIPGAPDNSASLWFWVLFVGAWAEQCEAATTLARKVATTTRLNNKGKGKQGENEEAAAAAEAAQSGANNELLLPDPAICPEETGWFNIKLRAQAREMGVITWDAAHNILTGFLYIDQSPCHGSQWFWKVVAIDLSRPAI